MAARIHCARPASIWGGSTHLALLLAAVRDECAVALSHFRINFGDLMGLNLVFPSFAMDHGLVICCSVGSGVSRPG